jgi:hypothetical protein
MTEDEARHALMEAWTPVTFDPVAAGSMLELAAGVMPRRLGHGLVDGRSINARGHVGVLSSRSASPHVDGDFSPWSALWVLKAGEGHRLSMADHVPASASGMGRIPTRKPHHHLDLRAGVVVLFHAHRLHWMKPATDGGMMCAVSVDFRVRPGRDEVEARLGAIVAAYGLDAPKGMAP